MVHAFKRRGCFWGISLFLVLPCLFLIYTVYTSWDFIQADPRQANELKQMAFNVRASKAIESNISDYERAHNFKVGEMSFIITKPKDGKREIRVKEVGLPFDGITLYNIPIEIKIVRKTSFVLYPDLSYSLKQ